LKTGLPECKLIKHGPKHILDVDALEPLYIHHPSILEDCLKREANRVAHSENLMNRVVFDSVDSNEPSKPEDKQPDLAEDGSISLPTPFNCDND
jgi:hypothetical protein